MLSIRHNLCTKDAVTNTTTRCQNESPAAGLVVSKISFQNLCHGKYLLTETINNREIQNLGDCYRFAGALFFVVYDCL